VSSAPFPHPQQTPLILTPKDEEILKQFAKFRLLTAQEITALCYSTGSHTYARSRLSALSGNQDITDEALTYGYPLYRIGFPTGKPGRNEKIFALSLTGARTLHSLGIPGAWYIRPSRLRTYSHSYFLHDLTRNRFIVALHAWAKSKPNLRIQTCLSCEIAKRPPTVEIPVQRLVLERGKPVKTPVMTRVGVIPDGEIVVTNTSTGERLLILLEIDQNTQAPQRLRNHFAGLLAYVKSPYFKARYGNNIPYRIVYATQGVTEPASTSRLKYLCDFTIKFLIERKRPQDSQYFRFTTINFATLYEDANQLFGSEQPSWYLPGDVKLENPVGLFTDAKPQPQKE
jgi:Replication-relaxation